METGVSDVYTIAIICSDKSHGSKTAQIALLGHSANGWEEWPGYRDRSLTWLMADNSPVDVFDRDQEQQALRRDRKRYQFTCRLCSFSKVVRSERFEPILDRLQHAGIRIVELRLLAAIL